MPNRSSSQSLFSRFIQVLFIGTVSISLISCSLVWFTPTPTTLGNHPIVVDDSGKIISWITPQSDAYDYAVNASWNFIRYIAPDEDTGYKGYMTSCAHEVIEPYQSTGSSLDMAGLFGEFVDSMIPYYAYTGDWAYVEIVREMLDHALDVGLTPSGWAWPNMPYADSPGGQIIYSGRIEPDKAGEFAVGLIQFYQITNNTKYLSAAIDIADVLAEKVRNFDGTHSPWPFRIEPETGAIIGEYTGHVASILTMFDMLLELHVGNQTAFESAREIGRNFLLDHVIPNQDWRYYFEDYDIDEPTKSEHNADETILYLLNNRDWDTDWEEHILQIWNWLETTLGVDLWRSLGVLPIQEQSFLYFGEFSHTARHASTKAFYGALKDSATYKEQAYRLFNWATYAVQPDSGIVLFSAKNVDNRRVWYTDGYADYVRHFMHGMGHFPEWAPANENHILKTGSVVQNVTYAANQLNYTVFGSNSSSYDTLRLNFNPDSVKINGISLNLRNDLNNEGYMVETQGSSDFILKLRYDSGTQVNITKSGGI